MNKQLRIAMIGQKRCPSREGGVEIVVEELATRIVNLGHKVTCYNRSGQHVSGKEHTTKSLKDYKGIRLKKVLTIDKKGLAAITSSFSAAICAAFGNYDIVHFHAEGPSFMCFIPKIFGKKIVVTIHGLDWDRTKWGKFAKWYLLQGEKMAVNLADEIIVLSDNVQKYFKKTYDRETVFIPNGVNKPTMVENTLLNNKYQLKGNDYILYLGRLVPEKGINYLIEAYKQVNTDKRLVIAGGASNTESFVEELHDLAKSDERIIFTGFVQGQMLEELYSNAYIYTLPSDLEGMPLSLLEAMSYGNCCLTSDICECAEVIEDKGISFKKGDVIDLKQKLQYLCDNENVVNEYKLNASDYVCGKYNWDDVVEKTMQLYEECIK